MPSFSRGLEKALHQAMNLARERNHEFATLEHLLLALTDDRETIAVLTGCDVDVDALKSDLEDFINEELDSLIVANGQDARPTALSSA
jgi:ATP-dependent Clp protease ATP-binding subunit ClpA